MKSTSPGSRLVRIAARSPARSRTGPEVMRRGAPISAATMWARVVLPRPGGPKSSTWSSDSPRSRAARMKTRRLSRIFACPTYSSSRRGRSDASIPSSSGSGAPDRRLSSTTMAPFYVDLRSEARYPPPPESKLFYKSSYENGRSRPGRRSRESHHGAQAGVSAPWVGVGLAGGGRRDAGHVGGPGPEDELRDPRHEAGDP